MRCSDASFGADLAVSAAAAFNDVSVVLRSSIRGVDCENPRNACERSTKDPKTFGFKPKSVSNPNMFLCIVKLKPVPLKFKKIALLPLMATNGFKC